MRALLDKLTFGSVALSLGLVAAFILDRGDFVGMGDGARTILFGLLLAAFVLAPYLIQTIVNRRLRSRAGAMFAFVGLVAAAGLGVAAYTTVLLTDAPDALDAIVFMAVPLWQTLIIGLAYGLRRAIVWYQGQATRDRRAKDRKP